MLIRSVVGTRKLILRAHGQSLPYPRLFWHRVLRKPFVSHGTYLVHDILGMSRNSQVTRYLILLVTFVLLTTMHILVCPGMELCVIPAQIAINIGAAVAMILEDGLIELYHKRKNDSGSPKIHDKSPSNAHANSTTNGPRYLSVKSRKMKPIVTVKTGLYGQGPQPLHEMEHKPKWTLRLLGYFWVAAFWTWLVSNLIYDLYRC